MIAALFSQDLALDVGSSRTRLIVRGAGVVHDLPTVVAIRTRRSGRADVVALGEDARAMQGRAPEAIRVVRPIRAGRVVEPAILETWLSWLVRSTHGGRTWMRPRILLAFDGDAPEIERRRLADACTSAGARELAWVPSALAAARGSGLAEGASSGHMVVDVGAGSTRVALIARGRVLASTSIEVAGEVFDGAVLRLLKRDHELLAGPLTAEALKLHLGGVDDADHSPLLAAGRCLRRGLPRSVAVERAALRLALSEPLAAIGAALRRVLELAPDELAQDVVDHGVLLCGGGSRLADVDRALRAGTGLAMLPVEAPDRAVARGLDALLAGRPFQAARAAPAWLPAALLPSPTRQA